MTNTQRNEHALRVVATPVGSLVLRASPTGLVSIDIGLPACASTGASNTAAEDILVAAEGQLHEYFAGRRTDFDVALDLCGTDFQMRAWDALCRIPYGTTVSYAQQGAMMGAPRAARAVGSANGRNPIPILVPCHRVVASDGSLGGYSLGCDMKRTLLNLEGVSVAG